MSVKEISSYQDAKSRVTTLFKADKGMRLKSNDDIENYARIAHFLSSTKAVMPALEAVSKGIWQAYNRDELKQSPNRFTQSIIRYAADNFGFAAQSNVVFIGPLGGPEFMNYVRSGVLWKDTFAPSHGEFSHSFQWLAAGHALSLGTATADLYKKAGQVFSNSEEMATRGADGALERARQPLWAWLVDSFQPGTLEAQIKDDDIQHVFSKTCRVPNQINGLAGGKADWFISLYVNHRKQWLAKLAERGKELRPTGAVEPDSNLLGIIEYQGRAYPAKTGPKWEPQMNPVSALNKPVPASGKVLKKGDGALPTTKAQREITYHGIKGTVSNNSIDTKALIV